MTAALNWQPPTHLVHAFSRDRGARPLRTFPNAHLTSLEIAAACKTEATDASFKRGVSQLHCRTLAMKRGCRARHPAQRSQLSERLPVAPRQLSRAATYVRCSWAPASHDRQSQQPSASSQKPTIVMRAIYSPPADGFGRAPRGLGCDHVVNVGDDDGGGAAKKVSLPGSRRRLRETIRYIYHNPPRGLSSIPRRICLSHSLQVRRLLSLFARVLRFPVLVLRYRAATKPPICSSPAVDLHCISAHRIHSTPARSPHSRTARLRLPTLNPPQALLPKPPAESGQLPTS